MPRAVALFSGGLDGMLAVRILQEQGFEVDALYIATVFACSDSESRAAEAADDLGVRLTVQNVADDYLELIRHPSFGYGRGLNPCIDCRIYMVRMAGRFMEDLRACLVITGEILGQRPMSQKRRDLDLIRHRSGIDDRLLRPLSAKLLEPTAAEREGLVDREKLFDFVGRGRGKLIELAARFGLYRVPAPSTGCALTESTFAPRVRDLIEFRAEATRWEFELLNVGRHFRLGADTKAVIGRDAAENASLRRFAARGDAPESALLEPENFLGPDALVVGPIAGATAEEALHIAAGLMLRYTRRVDPRNQQALVRVTHGDDRYVLHAEPNDEGPRTIILRERCRKRL